jgi:hypothetical protein
LTKRKVTLLATGDVILNRADPNTLFALVVDVLNSSDITFANCDQTYSDKGCPALGSNTFSDPRNIPTLTYAGLDVISLANNHCLDWGHAALLDTIKRLREVGIVPVGVGDNIVEARKPAILEREGTRIGFLAYCTLGPKGYEAEADRPGYAPVRIQTFYEQRDFQPGTPPVTVTIARKDDLASMVEDIKRLRSQVDVLAVSFHWGVHFIPELIPMYEWEVGHAAIDAGADVILGGHAHICKGIEVYKGKVIFHSMGNFVNGGPKRHPDSRWARGHDPLKNSKWYNFTPDPEIGVENIGWITDARKTFIAKVIIEGGKIARVSYIPCYVNKNCQPEVMPRSNPKAQEVFNYIEKVSRSQNMPVNFAWDGDEVVIKP